MPRKSRSRALTILAGRLTVTETELHRVESELAAARARWAEAKAAYDAVASMPAKTTTTRRARAPRQPVSVDNGPTTAATSV